jgi:hypothetical protein
MNRRQREVRENRVRKCGPLKGCFPRAEWLWVNQLEVEGSQV